MTLFLLFQNTLLCNWKWGEDSGRRAKAVELGRVSECSKSVPVDFIFERPPPHTLKKMNLLACCRRPLKNNSGFENPQNLSKCVHAHERDKKEIPHFLFFFIHRKMSDHLKMRARFWESDVTFFFVIFLLFVIGIQNWQFDNLITIIIIIIAIYDSSSFYMFIVK